MLCRPNEYVCLFSVQCSLCCEVLDSLEPYYRTLLLAHLFTPTMQPLAPVACPSTFPIGFPIPGMGLETHGMAGSSGGWVLRLKSCSHVDIAHPLGDDIIGIDCSSPPRSPITVFLLFNHSYGHCCKIV